MPVIPEQAQVTARHPLHCANKAVLSEIESPFRLGPLDELVFATVPIHNVFVYRNPPSTETLIPVDRLREALTHLLDYYPHLTGRLEFNQTTQAPQIGHLGAGAELLEARCDTRLDELIPQRVSGRMLVTDLPDRGSALIPPFGPSLEKVCRDPILAIQHTRFACGGVVLGIRIHHIVCDACGYFQLVRDLAELYRGLLTASPPSLACPPVIRSYLRDVSSLSLEERQTALEYQPTAYRTEQTAVAEAHLSRQDLAKAELPSAEPDKPPLIGRVLRFSGDDLLALKEQATEPGGGWVSTFEALSAYLCQRIYCARVQRLISEGMSESEAAGNLSPGFWTPMNIRDPCRLNLPARYFPNAVYAPSTTFSHELLANSPLWKVAKAVHSLICGVDAQQMELTTRWVALQPDKSRIRVSFTFADGNFTTNQWSGFGMYVGVDFDSIPPALVAPPFTDVFPMDGLAVVLSTEEEYYRRGDEVKPCAIDVNLTLSEPVWSIMDEDEEFRKYCC